MNLSRCSSIIAIIIIGVVSGQAPWGYRSGSFLSPSHWKDGYKSCGGYRQSPVNINTDRLQYWKALPPLTIQGTQPLKIATLKRTSHTVNIYFPDSWKISFGGQECLKPISIHWHWGSKDSQGSEHTLYDVAYPMESHLVTYDCNLYNNSKDGMTGVSGLHVFGIFYKMGHPDPAIANISLYLTDLITKETVSIPEQHMSLFFPTNLAEYFRYEGSLTTPPCTENVVWTVLRDMLTIDATQLSLFRSLPYGPPETGVMVDNFRPVIPFVNSPQYIDRVIYASFKGAGLLISKSILSPLVTLIVVASSLW